MWHVWCMRCVYIALPACKSADKVVHELIVLNFIHSVSLHAEIEEVKAIEIFFLFVFLFLF